MQLFLDKTATSLGTTALVVYSVHVIQLSFSALRLRRLIEYKHMLDQLLLLLLGQRKSCGSKYIYRRWVTVLIQCARACRAEANLSIPRTVDYTVNVCGSTAAGGGGNVIFADASGQGMLRNARGGCE